MYTEQKKKKHDMCIQCMFSPNRNNTLQILFQVFKVFKVKSVTPQAGKFKWTDQLKGSKFESAILRCTLKARISLK